jgi:hypothetical protein
MKFGTDNGLGQLVQSPSLKVGGIMSSAVSVELCRSCQGRRDAEQL